MKGCCGAVALILLCGVGGAVSMTVDPNLPGQTISAGASSVAWLTGVLSHVGDATPHATTAIPAPAPPIVVHVMPSPTLSQTPSPTSAPPASPTPPPAPVQVITKPSPPATPAPTASPSPAPTPSTPSWTIDQAWGASNLAWAEQTLRTDLGDDTAAETRFPANATYYAGWAAHWSAALTLIYGLEYPQTRPPQQTYLAPAEAAFTLAGALHREDEITTPANAWWDDQWIANYARLLALWEVL